MTEAAPAGLAPSYSGVWERNGRNPLVGALLLVFLAGTVYFLVQSVLLSGFVALAAPADGTPATSSAQTRFDRRFQLVLLAVLPATQFLLILLFPILVARRWHTPRIFRYFRYDRFPVVGAVAAPIGVLLLLPSVEAIGAWMYSLFPGLERLSEATEPLVHADSPAMLVFALCSVALTPAICEETLFRGYLQRTLERKMRAPWHFLVSGVVFALYHQEILSLPSLVLVGVYLGFVFNRSRSIYPGMLSHFCYNSAIIWLANLPERSSPFFLHDGGFAPVWIVISAGTFLLVVSGFAFFSRHRGVNSITKL